MRCQLSINKKKIIIIITKIIQRPISQPQLINKSIMKCFEILLSLDSFLLIFDKIEELDQANSTLLELMALDRSQCIILKYHKSKPKSTIVFLPSGEIL